MTLLNENCSVLLVKGLRILEGRRETYATYACVHAKVASVMSDSLQPHGP